MKLYKKLTFGKDYEPIFRATNDKKPKIDLTIFNNLTSLTVSNTNNNYVSFYYGVNHFFVSRSDFIEKKNFATVSFLIEWLLQEEKKREVELWKNG